MNATFRFTLRTIVLGVLLNLSLIAATQPTRMPLYPGLGPQARETKSASSEAKLYFNQGIGFLYGFNHGAAIRSFEEAVRLDPALAIAYWGIAFANGPHINYPVLPPQAAESAWKALTQAKKYKKRASPVEKALIDALSARYAMPVPADRGPLDQAFADAMRRVWKAHPQDADVGAFFAESMMNLRPWDQWTRDGQEQPGTREVLETLEAVLKLNPNHPLANHLTIHALEASPNPERADAAADRLRTLQPRLAHNVHMPSHIDIRRGRWQQAIETNLRAVEADAQFAKLVGPAEGFLNVYVAHNEHMLAYAAMMTGQREVAMSHIRALMQKVPASFLKEFATVAEGWGATPMEVLVRFGQWDAILAEPNDYPDYMTFTRAFHHAARAIALAAKKKSKDARAEQKLYVERLTVVPKEETFGNNTIIDIAAVLSPMVEGEILLREGKREAGLSALRESVKAEDALRYDEPPGWMIPARHSLGAALMKARRYAEAESVYREDLARLPDNGWSLFGLAESLRKQGKNADEAKALDARLKTIWAKADTPLTTSCLCQAN